MHARDWMIELRAHLHDAGWTVSNTAELFEIVRKEIEWEVVQEWSAKTDTLVFWLPSHPGEVNTVADLHYVTRASDGARLDFRSDDVRWQATMKAFVRSL